MNVCLYYHPEAYTISGPKLMGRHAAGESFLRAFLRYSNATEFWIQVEHLEHARHFAERARAFERNETIIVVDRQRLGALHRSEWFITQVQALAFMPGIGLTLAMGPGV